MSNAELDAVVRFKPTDQQTLLTKEPRKARTTNRKKCCTETAHFFSRFIKSGNRMAAEMTVRIAAKFIGETSLSAILAKR